MASMKKSWLIGILICALLFPASSVLSKINVKKRFPKAITCTPTLTWKDLHEYNYPYVTYDVIVYSHFENDPFFSKRWKKVFYREGIKNNSVVVYPPLEPKKKY